MEHFQTDGGDHTFHKDFTIFMQGVNMFEGLYNTDERAITIRHPNIQKYKGFKVVLTNVAQRATDMIDKMKVKPPYAVYWQEVGSKTNTSIVQQSDFRFKGKNKGKGDFDNYGKGGSYGKGGRGKRF